MLPIVVGNSAGDSQGILDRVQRHVALAEVAPWRWGSYRGSPNPSVAGPSGSCITYGGWPKPVYPSRAGLQALSELPGGIRRLRSKCRRVNVWTYLALAAGVLVILNVLFLTLMAKANRSGRDYDESRSNH